MKSTKLGRSELLAWVNTIAQSDYVRIESLSDGVGFCQILDAFFDNLTPEILNDSSYFVLYPAFKQFKIPGYIQNKHQVKDFLVEDEK